MGQQTLYFIFLVSTVDLEHADEFIEHIQKRVGYVKQYPEELLPHINEGEDFVYFHPVVKGCEYNSDNFHSRMTERYEGKLHFFLAGFGRIDPLVLEKNKFSFHDDKGSYVSSFKIDEGRLASRNCVRLVPYNPESIIEEFF
jgi:hypothetical protein